MDGSGTNEPQDRKEVGSSLDGKVEATLSPALVADLNLIRTTCAKNDDVRNFSGVPTTDAYERLNSAFPAIEIEPLGDTFGSKDELIILPTSEAIARINKQDYDVPYQAIEYYDQAALKEMLAHIVKEREDELASLERRKQTIQADLDRLRTI